MDLGMFGQKQCEPDSSDLDYTGKVLVLSPNTLKEEYWSPEDQLWLANIDPNRAKPLQIGALLVVDMFTTMGNSSIFFVFFRIETF